MSRPYLSIASATYSNNIVSLEIEALRMRGVTAITLGGFAQTQTIILATNSSGNSIGYYNTVDAMGPTQASAYTFSVTLTSTASNTGTTTFKPSTISIAFTGASASAGEGVSINLLGATGPSVFPGGGAYTFSSTQSITTALNTLVGSMSFTGLITQFSATVSGTSIIISSPYGNFYNSSTASVSTSVGAGLTASANVYTFTGGTTTWTLTLSDLSGIFGSIGTKTLTV